VSKVAEKVAIIDPDNADIQRHAAMAREGSLRLYVVVVRGTAADLAGIAESPNAFLVDPFYDADAQEVASRRGFPLCGGWCPSSAEPGLVSACLLLSRTDARRGGHPPVSGGNPPAGRTFKRRWSNTELRRAPHVSRLLGRGR